MSSPSRGPRIRRATKSRTEFPFRVTRDAASRIRIVYIYDVRVSPSLSVAPISRDRPSLPVSLSLFLSFPRASSPHRLCVRCATAVGYAPPWLRVCMRFFSPCVPCVCMCAVRGWLARECTNLFWKCHVCPHLPSSTASPPPAFFLRFTPVMCRAVDCHRVCMRAWVRVWASRIRSPLVVRNMRLPPASCDDGVHPETRGHVGTRLQIPASIMTPGSVNVR